MLKRKFLYRLDKTILKSGKRRFKYARSRQSNKAYALGKAVLVSAKHLPYFSFSSVTRHCTTKSSGCNDPDLGRCLRVAGFHKLQPKEVIFVPSAVFSDRQKLIGLP
jgi:hypothetical protein